MAEELVPIMCKFGRRADGCACYPDFNRIPIDIRRGMPWSNFVDVHGIKVHYDKVENLGTGAPNGTFVTAVPKDFADKAVELFPGPGLPSVEFITEAALEKFWNERSKVKDPDEILDVGVLQAIKLKKDLNLPLTQADQDALNPDHPSPGYRKNQEKSWKAFRKSKGIKLRK